MRDPYLYENSDVLINKKNIKEKIKLTEYENRMSNLAIVKLFKEDFIIKSTTFVFDIHKIMFENVYDWSGNPRTINLYKEEPILAGLSVEYSDYQSINNKLNLIDRKYLNQNLGTLNKEDFIHVFTRMISEIWKVHPFREGNTRTISIFAFLFLKQFNYKYNAMIIEKNAKYFRNALVMASLGEYSEYNYLQTIITDIIEGSESNKKQKYDKINNYKVEDYEYEYHKIKV